MKTGANTADGLNSNKENRTKYKKRNGVIPGLLLAGVFYFTAQAEFPGEGSGTPADPYRVGTAEKLDAVRNHLGAHFLQTADIDLGVPPWNEGEGWVPIGVYVGWQDPGNAPFTGDYDGGGYVIKGLYIHRPESQGLGLFGYTSGATISALGLRDVDITGEWTTGGLIGTASETTVDACYTTGDINGIYTVTGGLIGSATDTSLMDCYSTADVNGHWYVGGLIGNNDNGHVERCYSTGDVTGTGTHTGGLIGRSGNHSTVALCYSSGTVTGASNVGGLIGLNSSHSVLTRSYSLSDVHGSGASVGGLVGSNYEYSTIEHTFSTGTVSGDGDQVGGLVGYHGASYVRYSYSIGQVIGSGDHINGLIGEFGSFEVSDCYWNEETAGQQWGGGGEGRTIAQMTHPYDPDTYVDWDFDEIWAEDTEGTVNNGYPWLRGITPAPGIEYSDWAQDIPEGQRGYHDAPAGDNIPNLLKYASGLDAMTAYDPQDIMAIYTNAAPEVFAIRFYRSKSAIDAQVVPQQTGSLADGAWTTDDIDEQKLGEEGDREEWEASIPLGDRGFMRLKTAPVD